MAAALRLPVHIVEPCGFVLSDSRLKRAALDYMPFAQYERHASWERFIDARKSQGKLVILSTKGDRSYTDFAFRDDDWLVLGRESAGLPDHVHAEADARLVIPMAKNVRSLNVALAAAMVAGEAMRQTQWRVEATHA